MELKKLKCPECGAELEIPEDEDKIKCSFCGSKVIIDDKATEISRIKKAEVKAKKELDEHELDNRKKNDDYNDSREYKKKKNNGKIKGWSIAFAIICTIFTITAFKDGKILSGLVGIIQVAAFGYSILLCLDVLPEKVKNLHKIVFIGGIVLIIAFFSLGNARSKVAKEEAEDLTWDEYVLNEMLPEPEKLKGRLNYDSSDSLSLYIMEASKDDYKNYVKACKEKGFTIDISNSSTSFSAKNEEGYSLHLYYDEDDEEYSISLSTSTEEKNEVTSTDSGEDIKSEVKQEESVSTNTEIREDFKNAMDEYESFINEYVSFMKKYMSNPSDTSLLKDYSDYMTKYSKMVASFNEWNNKDMNAAETAYYLEVQSRVVAKLSEIQ